MKSNMLHVGLTGGLACGKSHAAQVFSELGASVIDADHVAHEVILPGTAAYREIVEHFGSSVLNPDDTINRKRLGDIVFSDPAALQKLNAIVHPRVFAEQERLLAECAQRNPHGLVIFDAPLLIETGAHKRVHKLVVVFCDPALQLARLMARDHLTREEALARIRAQLPVEEKLCLSDYRIDTSGTFKETHTQVEQIYKDLVRIALLDRK